MELVIRKSNSNEWGFVEVYNPYKYIDSGNLSITVGIGSDGKMKEPFVLRGGEFVPLKQIDEEMGIGKYIKAKKPFYCMLKDGFIITLKVNLNFETGEFDEEKSSYLVYMVSEAISVNDREGRLKLTRILEVPETVDTLAKGIMKEIASLKGDREAFLRMRFK